MKIILLFQFIPYSLNLNINIALRKPSYNLNPFNLTFFFLSGSAVDGVVTPEMTLTPPGFIFLVDLQGFYLINKIILFSRTDCCGNSSNNFLVGLLEKINKKNKNILNEKCGRYPFKTKINEKYILNCKEINKFNRFVIIYLKNINQTFGFSDVEIYGQMDVTRTKLFDFIGCFQLPKISSSSSSSSSSFSGLTLDLCVEKCIDIKKKYAAFSTRLSFDLNELFLCRCEGKEGIEKNFKYCYYYEGDNFPEGFFVYYARKTELCNNGSLNFCNKKISKCINLFGSYYCKCFNSSKMADPYGNDPNSCLDDNKSIIILAAKILLLVLLILIFISLFTVIRDRKMIIKKRIVQSFSTSSQTQK